MKDIIWDGNEENLINPAYSKFYLNILILPPSKRYWRSIDHKYYTTPVQLGKEAGPWNEQGNRHSWIPAKEKIRQLTTRYQLRQQNHSKRPLLKPLVHFWGTRKAKRTALSSTTTETQQDKLVNDTGKPLYFVERYDSAAIIILWILTLNQHPSISSKLS